MTALQIEDAATCSSNLAQSMSEQGQIQNMLRVWPVKTGDGNRVCRLHKEGFKLL